MLKDIPKEITRCEYTPLIEQVREVTYEFADVDEMLDFAPAALALGCTSSDAESIDETLTIRVMKSSGCI